ncbi:hypothetical protein Golob_024636 [Gossypium lobatum]|uniref:Uncharacterized protein n=1 Tax=Gossypium lobatum TaxID=34289 RepID=A0A7J8NE62_9ROSI|nr:hypothetical protein [Gossypium lobatum]
MRVKERVNEGSSDARNCYWCGFIVIFGRWKWMTLNEKLLGWCPTRSYIDVGTSTGSLYLKFGELLDIPLYLY